MGCGELIFVEANVIYGESEEAVGKELCAVVGAHSAGIAELMLVVAGKKADVILRKIDRDVIAIEYTTFAIG